MANVLKSVRTIATPVTIASLTAELAALKAASVKAPVAQVATLDAAMLKQGKAILASWTTGKGYVALGIREKTATGLGTRSAMLAVAAYGYVQGQGRILAMAVRAAMGLPSNVGGIDFPWLEKASNIATITSSSAIRLDAADGKMRLMVLQTGKAATAARKANPVKVVSESVNGPVTVTKAPRKAASVRSSKAVVIRPSDAELAASVAAQNDIDAQEQGNG